MGIDAQMFVRTKAKVTPEMVLEKAWLLATQFGSNKFWIFRDRTWSNGPQHALTIEPEYTQDGETLYPEEGETFIEVHPATRYYSEGYARGDLPFLISIARWLEHHFPGGEVWYGGDSSGVVAAPFPESERQKLWLHFCEDRNSYGNYFSRGEVSQECSWCKQPMVTGTWFGGGRATGLYCTGCDERLYVPSSGDPVRFADKKKYEEYVESIRLGGAQ